MNTTFDLIEAIQEQASCFLHETGFAPEAVAISPNSYRRLLAIKSQEQSIGNLIIGCSPLTQFQTAAGTLRIIIDEILGDTTVEIA
ncbi:MAG TPA: hypothetical protein VI704_00785 [Bacteroidota bacterium]|nr:hypothetical protein [Bacteroidota bacterium]